MMWVLLASAFAAEPAAEAVPLPAQMHQRFGLITHARAAIEGGDLAVAKAKAQELVDLEPPTGLVDPWRPYVAELKADAAVLAKATSLEAAAQQVTAIAITCAGCHQDKGGGPLIPSAESIELTPETRKDVGMDLLWLSLLTNSSDAWARGAAALGGDDQPQWSAVSADTPEARAKAFAALLVK